MEIAFSKSLMWMVAVNRGILCLCDSSFFKMDANL